MPSRTARSCAVRCAGDAAVSTAACAGGATASGTSTATASAAASDQRLRMSGQSPSGPSPATGSAGLGRRGRTAVVVPTQSADFSHVNDIGHKLPARRRYRTGDGKNLHRDYAPAMRRRRSGLVRARRRVAAIDLWLLRRRTTWIRLRRTRCCSQQVRRPTSRRCGSRAAVLSAVGGRRGRRAARRGMLAIAVDVVCRQRAAEAAAAPAPSAGGCRCPATESAGRAGVLLVPVGPCGVGVRVRDVGRGRTAAGRGAGLRRGRRRGVLARAHRRALPG